MRMQQTDDVCGECGSESNTNTKIVLDQDGSFVICSKCFTDVKTKHKMRMEHEKTFHTNEDAIRRAVTRLRKNAVERLIPSSEANRLCASEMNTKRGEQYIVSLLSMGYLEKFRMKNGSECGLLRITEKGMTL